MAREIAAHPREQMSRAARTARGAAFASAATLLAAASHALAGGDVTPLALVATTLLALPASVALAGRRGSLWRLALGVAFSQFIYHWSFAGLGASGTGGAPGSPAGIAVGPHAHHAGAESHLASLAAAGSADWSMWIAHACAAAVTIALLWRGERAMLGLATLLRRLLPTAMPSTASMPSRAALPLLFARTDALRERLTFLSELSHRGPPHLPAPAR